MSRSALIHCSLDGPLINEVRAYRPFTTECLTALLMRSIRFCGDSFNWYIAKPVSVQSRLKVEEEDFEDWCDESDADFSWVNVPCMISMLLMTGA